MFESGYLTLFGKEFGDDKCQARQAAQKALVLNALENFKEFDKIFPALVAGLPIHVFMSAYSAREVSGLFLHLQWHEKLSNQLELPIFKQESRSTLRISGTMKATNTEIKKYPK